MSQYEILDFLQTNPNRWYTSEEIAEEITMPINQVYVKLSKMHKVVHVKQDLRVVGRLGKRKITVYKHKGK